MKIRYVERITFSTMIDP